jgi:hypothetical protein
LRSRDARWCRLLLARCRDNRVVVGRPRDLQVVCPRDPRRTQNAPRRFRIFGCLRDNSPCCPHLVDHGIDLVSSVHHQANRETKSHVWARIYATIGGQRGPRKECQHRATELEGGEALLIDDLRPIELQWEVDQPTYRVYFWHQPKAPSGVPQEHMAYHSDEHRLREASDVHEVIAWPLRIWWMADVERAFREAHGQADPPLR